MTDGADSKHKPLLGQRILITRPKKQAAAFAAQVEQLGGVPVAFPVIEIVPATSREQQKKIEAALAELPACDWLVLTSPNGAEHMIRLLNDHHVDFSIFDDVNITAVGPKTAARLEQSGLRVRDIPRKYDAESLTEWLIERCKPGEKLLLARGNLARPYLPEQLARHQLHVIDLVVYETIMPDASASKQLFVQLGQGRIDWVTFTSSSTVDNLMKLLEPYAKDPAALINRCRIACIGPVTAKTARSRGLRIDCMPQTYTTEAMLQEMIDRKEHE